jgi:hypothetical protein
LMGCYRHFILQMLRFCLVVNYNHNFSYQLEDKKVVTRV